MPVRAEYTAGMPSWVDLATTDPEAAKAFYARVFGWTYVDLPTGDETVPVYTMATLAGRHVAGMSAQPASLAQHGAPPAWSTYMTVDDVDEATKHAEAAGAQVFMTPMDVMDVGRMSVAADPAGAVFCMWQARTHIGAELVNEPGSVCWNELLTSDVSAAKAFYGALLGWAAETADYGAQAYTMFTLDGAPVAGGMALPADGVLPHWAVYFAVADADAAVAAAEAAGGTVRTGPFDTPAGRMAGLADPQGASFWVIKMADLSAGS